MANTLIKQNLEYDFAKINRNFAVKFKNSQWPAPKEEEWRRTKLSKFDMSGFNLPDDNLEKTAALPVKNELSNDFSVLIRKKAGRGAEIIIGEIGAEDITVYEPGCQSNPDEKNAYQIKVLVEDIADRVNNKTEFLALSSFKDTVFIIIPDNLELDKPVIVEFETGEGRESFLPNLFVGAGKNVQARIVEKITTVDNSDVSGLLNIFCGSNSNIQTATVTDLGNGSKIFINRRFLLHNTAFLSDFQSYTGGELIKIRTEVDLSGEKADARLYGVIMAGEKTHIDVRTVQYHKVGDCFSQAMIKSVVKDKGRSVYQGLIEVEEGAALTDAYLTNHNLILNNGARADSIPSLKIRNNDVKCSHGSTTGKINEEQLLYLTSRGIGREEARQMILEGFLGQVYDQLADDIKSYCSPFVMDKLKIREEVY